MKFVIAQIFSFCILREIKCLDIAHYHRGLVHEEQKKPIIPILKFITEQSQKGWKYSYESGNGIQAEEVGYIKNKGDEKHESVVQQGTVTYHDEHGHPITLHYIADEHGFQPQGEHLPTPPPIPEEIRKAMEQDEGGQAELTEPQEESERKDEYEQAQSYAESQVHSKTQVYEPSTIYGNADNYRKKHDYGRQGQYQLRRFVNRN